MNESAVPSAPTWWTKCVAIALEAGLAAGIVEWVLLLARARGARTFPACGLLLVAAIGACIVASLPVAMVVAIRSPQRRWIRIAVALTGCAIAVTALAADAEAYVRLYGAQHAALGFAALAGITLVRGALPISHRGMRARTIAAIALGVAAPMALRLRDDARAYAAQRGVLLVDAMWATHRDVHSLPRLAPPTRPAGPATHALANRPSLVVVITVDALRFDAAMNNALLGFQTIRNNAVRFDHAYATAAWTVPSVYSLMTARGPWRTAFTPTMFVGDTPVEYRGRDRNPRRVWPLPMRDRAATLAEAMHAAGYRTATCASLPFFVREGGIVRGFDDVDDGVYRTRNRSLRGTTSDMLTACGLAMIERAHGEPLFLWLHYSDPHEPYSRHEGIRVHGDADTDRYAGEVAFVDEHLRGLLANIHRRVGLGRTLLVLTADHGEEFGEHGGSYHAVTLYDEVAHVPLFIAAPGVPSRDVHDNVSLIDVAPTILELIGAPSLPDAEGVSLAAEVQGTANRNASRVMFAESIRYGRGVRAAFDGRWSLIYEARAGTYELFDRANDPGEQYVVTDSHRDVAARLARAMNVPAP